MVQQPPIQQDIHCPVRRRDLHTAKRLLPELGHRGQHGGQIGASVLANESLSSRLTCCLAQEEDDLAAAAGLQHQPGLQRPAGIQSGADGVGQCSVAGQGQRVVHRAVAANECLTITGPGRLGPRQIGKGNAVSELDIPRISGEEGARFRIDNSDNEWAGGAAGGPKDPFHIGCDGQAPGPIGVVCHPQLRDLDCIIYRNELQQVQGNAMRIVFEPAIALSVRRNITRACLTDRQRRRPPYFAGILVSHVDHFAGRIAHRVVRPWSQMVLLTVERPGGPAPIDRDVEAERIIADDIDPGGGRRLPAFEDCNVLAATICEATKAVKML